MKDTRVESFSPPNMHFIDETPRTVTILGNNFLPITDEIFCRLEYPSASLDFVEIPAIYVNNHTLECDLPAPPTSEPLPLAVTIEVSFNEG